MLWVVFSSWSQWLHWLMKRLQRSNATCHGRHHITGRRTWYSITNTWNSSLEMHLAQKHSLVFPTAVFLCWSGKDCSLLCWWAFWGTDLACLAEAQNCLGHLCVLCRAPNHCRTFFGRWRKTCTKGSPKDSNDTSSVKPASFLISTDTINNLRL